MIQKKRDPSEERHKIRKDKNKEAARRSRNKRKKEIQSLLLENKLLKKENLELKEKMAQMQRKNYTTFIIRTFFL